MTRVAASAQGLTKHCENELAVDVLSFDAPEGRVVGFLGPNGAGGSTTMRMLVGAERATRLGATTEGG